MRRLFASCRWLIAVCFVLSVSVLMADTAVRPSQADSDVQQVEEILPAEPFELTPPATARWVKTAGYEEPAAAASNRSPLTSKNAPQPVAAGSAVSGEPSSGEPSSGKPSSGKPSSGKLSIGKLSPVAPPSGELSFAKRAALLEVKLSRQIAEQPTLWQFDHIQQEAAKLLTAAGNETERQAVRAIAARVERFGQLGHRYRQAVGVSAAQAIGVSNAQLSGGTIPLKVVSKSVVGVQPATVPAATVPAATGPAATGPAATVPSQPDYDAVGELRPVVSKRAGAPKYALVGSDGKVVTFITPTAGLDLKPLLGKQVGARGARGFMPEYNHRHLTAQRIAPLDTLRR